MKNRTKPFASERVANSFANLVGGRVTKQGKTHHVHYKSDGVYRGKNQDFDDDDDDDGSDFNSGMNGYGTHWHDYDDL